MTGIDVVDGARSRHRGATGWFVGSESHEGSRPHANVVRGPVAVRSRESSASLQLDVRNRREPYARQRLLCERFPTSLGSTASLFDANPPAFAGPLIRNIQFSGAGRLPSYISFTPNADVLL